jgi:excisionase family DNA binding protein
MASLADANKGVAMATYTRLEVAELLGISERHLDRMTAENRILGVLRIGRVVRFSRRVVVRWLNGGDETAQNGVQA